MNKVDNEDSFERGVLRDSARARVPLMLRDGNVNPQLSDTQRAIASQRRQDSYRVVIVDGNGSPLDFAAGGRPGYRIRTDDAGSEARDTAYQRYETEITNQYRCGHGGTLCVECGGSGRDHNHAICDNCSGDGVVAGDVERDFRNISRHDDGRTARDDRAEAYAAYDAEIAKMWRTPR